MGTARVKRIEDDDRLESFRRSIVAAVPISKGTIINGDMLDFKRPGRGISPEYVNFIIGKKANRDIDYDDLIRFEDF